MGRKFFGTDGIRGRTNEAPITAAMALKVGQAAGQLALRGDHRHRVVIGKDTRLSGYMLEGALEAGFTSVGVDVTLVGPMPTPAVAMLTKSMRADIGVMISASHNPFEDNGIKLFGPDGYKLSDEDEEELERLLEAEPVLAPSDKIGRVKRIDDVKGRYIHFAKATFPDRLRLDGMKIVIDCANGAGYNVAPAVLWELGADVVSLGVEPDGTNINKNCGSTHPQAMQDAVVDHKADIGLALDGDADRLIVCDEKGTMIDGDQLMALIAKRMQADGELKGDAVVATVMSNMGLERCLKETGMGLTRTKVGDRHVLKEMRRSGCNVGGEQSGHIILSDHATTGDGLLAGLQVLAALVEAEQPASKLLRQFDPVPQLLKNVRFKGGDPLSADSVKKVIEAAEKDFGSSGRLVIRKSGTEPLIRVMAEGDDSEQVTRWVDEICASVEQATA